MQNLQLFILFLCIIILSGLGVSFYKEGLNCSPGQVEKDKICVTPKNERDTNTFIVIIILISIIVWMVMIKQNS